MTQETCIHEKRAKKYLEEIAAFYSRFDGDIDKVFDEVLNQVRQAKHPLEYSVAAIRFRDSVILAMTESKRENSGVLAFCFCTSITLGEIVSEATQVEMGRIMARK